MFANDTQTDSDTTAWTRAEGIDEDNDTVSDTVDNCLGLANPDQADADEDGGAMPATTRQRRGARRRG